MFLSHMTKLSLALLLAVNFIRTDRPKFQFYYKAVLKRLIMVARRYIVLQSTGVHEKYVIINNKEQNPIINLLDNILKGAHH